MKDHMNYMDIEGILAIVEGVRSAVSDDIREDVLRNNLETQNSLPSRIWDFINTNLIKITGSNGLHSYKFRRGPWDMVYIYDSSTGFLFTLMREKRFSELKSNIMKRKKPHYIDIFARSFNNKLKAGEEQTMLYEKEFKDEDDFSKAAEKIIRDLQGGVDVVKNHVLILFETAGFNLISIRAVMITPSLDIAEASEENWSKYISSNESLIVEKVESRDINYNNCGLKLSVKALARKTNNIKAKEFTVKKKENV